MRDLISEWNPWWEQQYSQAGVPRDGIGDILKWVRRKEIISIVGVRRAGKTTLLYQIIGHLINQKGINPKRIFFIKADDDRARKENLIDQALDSYRTGVCPEPGIYVFIDEVQEIPGWQKTLKRLYDLNPELKLFISGSNASLIKEELSSLLAGRCAYFEVYPFSFAEFLRAKGITGTGTRMRDRIRHSLVEYIDHGSFPEVALEADEGMKRGLIGFYFDSIFYRDIIKRNKIRNPAKLETLVKYLLQNISNLTNYSKAGKLVGLSTDSVGEYVKAMEDAYLLFPINIYAPSYKKQVIHPKKVYCIDTGIRNIMGFRFSEDMGRLYENLVYIALRRRGREIFYWKDTHECDFVARKGRALEAIQVCYDLRTSAEREVLGLLGAMDSLGLKEGAIITDSKEGEERHGGRIIKYVPLWRFLLEE